MLTFDQFSDEIEDFDSFESYKQSLIERLDL